MARFDFRPIRRGKSNVDYRLYREALRAEFEDIKPAIVRRFEDVVSDWSHRPDFVAVLRIEGNVIRLWVKPQGEHAAIWRYVDEGTRAHVIRPRRGRFLAFRGGYSARTRPGGRAHVGDGQAHGQAMVAQVVHHPGSAAREFTRTILDDYEPDFTRALQEAIHEAATG